MDPFYFFIGILILGTGLYFTISDYYHSKYGFHTVGTVSKIVGKWSGSGGKVSYLYFPMVQFKTEDNRNLELELEVGASLPLYNEGQRVKIIYYNNKIHPTGTGWKLFFWSVLLLGLATVSYQLVLLANSDIWNNLNFIWKILK
ncbi:hypothetical protein JAO76_14235 [Pontibacter sp. BT310]|uniref:DUF3592 domain-containing protein n=1 Tax=Pontibacter populi TaxID=890055 RepID=A0ABS6XDZ9_9BACT|nr:MULTISPECIES: DUF3592 domain-containing protein [Pontibacter]MBJ6119364.1 hypothetical protein [Pontibacter sp. BT310]MBR0571792.1 hypothetical protein [Microvirga sp. STS03]MBW3366218.1 DUF3592 domain-containing protein [Pontibacter populi]